MGTVQVNTSDGVLQFKIAGDKPTPVEQMRIQRIVANQAPQRKASAERKKDEQLFDRSTGIQNKELRRKLSRAENKEEEDLAMMSMGLLETDFLRDMRGNLAVTPEGAKKLGLDTDKNVIIDERGFTGADFADLSSLGREITGGVAGALAGQAAIPIPILGAMIGAAAGTGGAKLLEEGQEKLQGLQTETLGEVGKAAGKDALIAAAGEGVFGVVGKLFGKVLGKTGSDLTPDQLKIAGESLEEGITPTLSQVGANPIVSRQQAMSEKVIKTSKRLRDNHDAIMAKLAKFRSDYGAANPAEAADALTQAAKTGNRVVLDEQKRITEDLVRNLKQVNESLGAATTKDAAINKDLYNIVREAYKAFDDDMLVQFSSINKLMDDAGGDIAAFNVKAIKEDAKERLGQFVGVSTGNQAIAKSALQDIISMPDNASFAQIYRARKNLNDTWLQNFDSSNVADVKKKFLGRLDDMLAEKSVKKALNRKSLSGLTPEQRELYTAASKQIVPAREAFKKGIKQFENLNSKLGVRQLASDVKGGRTPKYAGIMKSVIKPDDPDQLTAIKKAVGDDKYETVRERLAGEWMRNAFKESFTEGPSGKFSTTKFRDSLERLGTTSKELFGEQKLAQINKLAEQMSAINLSNVTDTMIDDVLARGADESAVNLLRNLKTVVDEKSALDKSRAFKQLQDGSITVESAAEVIASGTTKDTDVAKLIKYFESPDDINKIRAYYVDNIIGDFGDSFLTDTKLFKQFGQRLQNEYKTGKLTTVFGDEMAKDMDKFGRIMVFNSKAAEGGDLVAANIAASPLENLGKIARLGVFGRLLSSAPAYKSITKQYEAMTKGASQKTKAQVFGQLLADAFASAMRQTPLQATQEAAQEATKTVSSLVSNVQQQKRPAVTPTVRAPAQPEQKSVLPGVPVPEVKSGQLVPYSEMLPPYMQKQNSVRQRAKANTGDALALLGGLGNQDILTRQ